MLNPNAERWRVRDTNGEMCYHRTPIKVICNPFLRLFGFVIASEFVNDEFVRYVFCNFDRKTNRIWPRYT